MEQWLEHEFVGIPEHFWRIVLFDEDYEKGLYEHLRLNIENKVLRREGQGDDLIVWRELHLTPQRDIPAALAKLLRGARLVKEKGRFDARANRFEVHIDLPMVGRLVDFQGRYTWKQTAPDRFTRFWQGHCAAKIPFIGHTLERYLLGEVEVSLAQAYRFTKQWLGSPSDG